MILAKKHVSLVQRVQHQSKGVGEADFARQDESTDTGFYSQPRICTHVDDSWAAEDEKLAGGGNIVKEYLLQIIVSIPFMRLVWFW